MTAGARRTVRHRPARSGAVQPAGSAVNRPDRTAEAGVDSSREQYLLLLEGLFVSFREQAGRSFGQKGPEMISRAEETLRSRSPDFALDFSDPAAALSVLDLIEVVVADAPFFRRARLRQSVITLVADLYSAHFDLLERYQATAKLEQFYYRLKKP
jgi:hypothetical protein